MGFLKSDAKNGHSRAKTPVVVVVEWLIILKEQLLLDGLTLSIFSSISSRKPAMPKQTPRPRGLIQLHKIMKLRTFTDLNKRRKSTIPKK